MSESKSSDGYSQSGNSGYSDDTDEKSKTDSKPAPKQETDDTNTDDDDTSDLATTDTDDSSDGSENKLMLTNLMKEYSELKRNTFGKIEKLEKQNAKLTSDLAESKKLNDIRKDQALKSAESVKKVVAELIKMKDEKTELVNQIEDERRAHADTIKQLHLAQSQISSGMTSVPTDIELTLRLALDGSKVAEAILVKNVDSEKDDLRMQQSLLEKKVLSLGQDIVLLKQELDTNKDTSKKNDELQKKVEDLQKKNTDLEEAQKKIKKENDLHKRRGSSASSTLSIKAESSEATLKLKSFAEDLLKTLRTISVPDDILELLDSVEEMTKDQVFHRLMFHSIFTKCKRVLNPLYIQNGYTTDSAIYSLYTPTIYPSFEKKLQDESYMKTFEKLDYNFKGYNIVMKNVIQFEEEFKKKVSIRSSDDSNIVSRMSVSRRQRKGAEFLSGNYNNALIFPSSKGGSSSSGGVVGNDVTSSVGEACREAEDIERNLNEEERKACSVSEENKDIVSNVFYTGDYVCVCSSNDQSRSKLSLYPLTDCEHATMTVDVEFVVTAVYVHDKTVICGSDNGLAWLYKDNLGNKVNIDIALPSKIVLIGSLTKNKRDIWLLSETGEIVTYKPSKKDSDIKRIAPKLVGSVTCGCVMDKTLYIGTFTGVCKTEFPPKSKSKYVSIKEIMIGSVNAIASVQDTLYVCSKEKNHILVMRKDKQISSISIEKPMSLFPFLNDMWVGCANCSIKAIDNETLAVTEMTEKSATNDNLVLGTIQEARETQGLRTSYFLYYSDKDVLKRFQTPYYVHRYIINNTEGICLNCHGKVHKAQGLTCAYCGVFYHSDCFNDSTGFVKSVCSRDETKRVKPKSSPPAQRPPIKIITTESKSDPNGSPK
ncbi:hypothetical protein EIN_083490 [Entamoeba invadens IP1]|uniref:hypothetical protein n=1 Tax=Entamoeba invadens IP1 TaxID=370355 RepID=UPI0002C3EB7B|nr:hypothetical protein EIN_083490 [Entamoeba invadens IP1]ELP85217.1 hypothetical protein EIN_083490 [Entamoeba invadens IP1]|eukprot:XP_004184563.1 hypothetical protein EIN_083490 [Entamoeba invadens IP1]